MRLLNVETLQVELFDNGPRCAYAILSHTWGAEEVSFQDMQDLARAPGPGTVSPFVDSGYNTTSSSRTNTGTNNHFDFGSHGVAKTNPLTSKKGYSKILGCCAKARTEGYRYVWIDTCCIDKSSSAELSEAINSMFKWYHDAEVCYAYLSDISLLERLPQHRSPTYLDHPMSDSGDNRDAMSIADEMEELLYGSKWFTRGWTLQELIAPSDVVFCDRLWREIGTRESLSDDIAAITGIDAGLLRMERKLDDFSVAQRMSWAATRRTTRIEDEAYCLMGLFDVHMPLLYGEGQKAFKRLQLEIMRQCYDPSILAWASSDSYAVIEGVLAHSPSMFESCGGITWIAADGVMGGDNYNNSDRKSHEPNNNSNFYHEIIGSSLLRMRVPVSDFNARHTDDHMVYRSYWNVFGSLEGSMVHVNNPSTEEDPFEIAEEGTTAADLIYFPRRIDEFESAYLHDSRYRSFNYSFLKHKVKDIMLVPLFGCTVLSPNSTTKGERYTVGITFCTDSAGHFKRVHFPSRFLVPPSDIQRFFTSAEPMEHGFECDNNNYLTLHLSLTGTEILLRPPVPKWARCLVRIPPSLLPSSDTTSSPPLPTTAIQPFPISLASTPNLYPSSSPSYFSPTSLPIPPSTTTSNANLPWTLSHTIPRLAADGSGCWYLDRWSEVTDRADFSQQPCFSLHKAGVPRALAFRHGMDPVGLGFLLVFWVVRSTTRGDDEQWVEVGVLRNEGTGGVMWVKSERELVKVMGERGVVMGGSGAGAGGINAGGGTEGKKGKRTRKKREWEFDVGEGMVLRVKIRKNPDYDIAVLDFREIGGIVG
ncbi:heterokaryon incompatibility protein-domain-containing protein [Sordaria brevicollis]|uniref:Heterokaryon incompatibility protein-domain-containing protein n=1 Tax=Sordaria brevicollis TaxID=83679 RepID=A0AAE0PIB6_SORBR|nr:heterokaryon incompatibility protein-domain-containing protein [Sordaria brevicollis]